MRLALLLLAACGAGPAKLFDAGAALSARPPFTECAADDVGLEVCNSGSRFVCAAAPVVCDFDGGCEVVGPARWIPAGHDACM